METIHFRIDAQTKQLAMQAAKRQQTDLTKLMRERAEQLAAEELEYQTNTHAYWLETQINEAIQRYESQQTHLFDADQSQQKMQQLRRQLTEE
ncbi:damage-inducible protein J [Testudinibacter sp. TR-2022]|uniref:damage-inducible protein J n=1 Tax=Testudinibacter sp. TR-2022 TaxID=2585029 RepID=UPI001117DF40|nr:damage-inducible protein J [Testudinibacter sp. TR-2022]TNH03680.1 damage-inducible protein J [Pasteurellaceae bacterium Phil31]TNH08060.1 damage-inducible protein J [Testudinibacter sp. TR-2022]TNH10272.1 damage-inducible protein J [Testudinibacter sp. TR-2022]TNH12155.1 damage-inducible protein J [Testudinibacter sp. TR-2022]TNH16104.1 damage-inducible protein J [Testudinibacter sp. TR-2022]